MSQLQKTLAVRLLVFALFFCSELRSQISDDFSDGNFNQNPEWQGDTGDFIVNDVQELQLFAPDAGVSMLAVGGAIPDSAVWLLDMRLEFDPSTSNLLRIYLLADQANLLQSNGYYLEIGESGSADALHFYRQDAGVKTTLADGALGLVAGGEVAFRLRVKRSKAGNWQIETAMQGEVFQGQATASDATYGGASNSFFGFYCKYTDTRKDKYFFDNLSLLPDVPDTKGPVLLGAQAVDATTVSATFDEPVDAAAGLDPNTYSIAGLGQPQDVIFSGAGHRVTLLAFSPGLNTGNYTLAVGPLADTLGNVSGPQITDFDFVKIETASEFDVLIYEIMADPSPPADTTAATGLPQTEWLELHNRSDKIIDLQTLYLSDGSVPKALPAHLLYPDSFIVIASTSGAAALAKITPNVRPLSGFPTLNDDGDVLTLTDSEGKVVDMVMYESAWHADAKKRNGGFSLERINPSLPCLGAENWQSCPAAVGGTPGRQNASLNNTQDTSPPDLLKVVPETSTRLLVTFSEGLNKATAANSSVYIIEPFRTILSATPSNTDRNEVTLVLAEPLEKNVLFSLTTDALLQDCSGNSALPTDTVYFGVPDVPVPQDIVINEVLFDPANDKVNGVYGVDYVELYNRSTKIFNWEDFYLANFSMGRDSVAIARNRLFLPGGYAVFTPNVTDILTRYPAAEPLRLMALSLPALPNDVGNVLLFYQKGNLRVTVDSFDYQTDYHNALLSASDRSGTALERIDPDGVTNNRFNWTSAARMPAGRAGTPTLPNSQRRPDIPSDGMLVQLDPARLSPDGDGVEDFLDIRYQLPQPGYGATMTIYDSGGIPVKHLVRQQLIGTEGALRWDGDLDDGTKARPGIYILYLEIASPEGIVQQFKKTFGVVKCF